MASLPVSSSRGNRPHAVYTGIDVAKMAAALLVVAIHAQVCGGMAKHVAIDMAARLAVPFFFMASAFFFFRRSPGAGQLRRFIYRLLLLFGSWFLVTLPVTVLHAFIEPPHTFAVNLLFFVRNALLHSAFQGAWFIVGLGQAVALLWWWNRRCSTRWQVAVSAVVYGAVVLLSFYAEALPAGLSRAAAAVDLWYGHVELSFLSALLPCAVGKWVAEHEGRVRLWPVGRLWGVLVLCVAAMALEVLGAAGAGLSLNRSDAYFSLMPCVSVVFVLVCRWQPVCMAGVSQRLRAASTLFYFSHFLFVFILVLVNKHIVPVSPMLKYVLVVLAGSVLSVVVLRCSRHLAWLRFLY